MRELAGRSAIDDDRGAARGAETNDAEDQENRYGSDGYWLQEAREDLYEIH